MKKTVLIERKTPVVGIPRALLYYRYAALWETYFHALGIKTVVSPPTSRQLLEDGAAMAVDETCLSVKIFYGHVKALIGKCDFIFVPRVATFGLRREMCIRFSALYDQTRNVFRESGQRFLSYNLDANENIDQEKAFLNMGETLALGYSQAELKKAYAAAEKADQRAWREKLRAQEQILKSKGLKILLVGHPYILDDPYLGKPVTDFLRSMDVLPLRADIVNRDAAIKRSLDVSPSCKWEVNRELLGGIEMLKKEVDGVILVSAFPCGPDAMTNDLVTRKVKDVPLLNLVMDTQTGSAGTETRLESFVDIIRLKKGVL